jgi:FkbM family methyltransferase
MDNNETVKIVNPYTFWRRQKDKLITIMPDALFTFIVNLRYRLNETYPYITKEGPDFKLNWNGFALLSNTPKYLMNPSLESYEKKNEQFIKIEKGDTVVDVGACMGDSTLPAIIKTGSTGRVIAIEPSPSNLIYLRKNVAKYPNVSILDKAVFNKKCKIPFSIHNSAVTGNMINLKTENRPTGDIQVDSTTIDVEADTLDNLLEPFKKIDFLKIDVQGFEIEALEGCQLLMKTTPKIVVETHGFDEEPLWKKVNAILSSNGYTTSVTPDRRVHAYKRIIN